MPITIDACVAQHQGDRKEQQDRVSLVPPPRGGGVALAVVADGMGGHTGGVLAAQQVIHTASSNLGQFSARSESARSMLEAGSRPSRKNALAFPASMGKKRGRDADSDIETGSY